MFSTLDFPGLPEWLSYAVFTFVGFFPMVDPLGILPLFNSLTEGLPEKVTRYIAWRSCLIAFLLTLMFGFLGEMLFDLFHITIDGLKIVGGVIFFFMGYDMLNARISSIRASSSQKLEVNMDHADEIALTPLAVPMLCGPGVIASSIITMDSAEKNVQGVVGFVVGVAAIFAFTWICFRSARTLFRLFGPSGNRVILRLMGLFLMIIAVELFFSGLTPLVRKMLSIS